MRALELIGFEGPASLRVGERDLAEPGPNEVRIRFRNMALNHLDVFITRGLPKRPLPAILGSDGAGTVDVVGPRVDNVAQGDEVVLYPIVSCGNCPACQAGQEVHCPQMAILGEHTEGTFQDALVVPARICHPRPAHLSFEETAALPLAWLTAWRLLFTRGGLKSGDWVVLVGIGGGVATACLLLGKAHGLRVIATSRDEAKRQQALQLGADAALPSEGFSKQVQEVTGGVGARAVVDTVGPATFDESIRSLGREGMILTVGATSGPKIDLLLPRMWFRHLSLVTSTMGNHSEFRSMLDDVNAYHLRPPVDRVFPLPDGDKAFERLEAGSQFGKVVLSA
ncbi:MAG: alcohol dehydrogenase catalytic domain-containing protein [Chloroflexi bacterium]|nr:alcohol dehydrogenase catalytic domain-containing protein [Chloroflexota bacterium]